LPVAAATDAVRTLAGAGWHVIVTGSAGERELAERVAGSGIVPNVTVKAGETDLAEFARLIASASAVVCGNTAAAHVAAAVGTPVVEAFAPVVAPHRWRPWNVSSALLGVLNISCAGCRARTCPVPGQPCLDPFTAPAVLDAVTRLTGRMGPAHNRAVDAA
jgi:ADP-heptose:LPS heptosyltransferase